MGPTWDFVGHGGQGGPWAGGGQIGGLYVGPTWAAHLFFMNVKHLITVPQYRYLKPSTLISGNKFIDMSRRNGGQNVGVAWAAHIVGSVWGQHGLPNIS